MSKPIPTIYYCTITNSIRDFLDNVKLSYVVIISIVYSISTAIWPVLLMYTFVIVL